MEEEYVVEPPAPSAGGPARPCAAISSQPAARQMPAPPSAHHISALGGSTGADSSLLHRIRAQFRQCASQSNKGESSPAISVEDLARYWWNIAEEERSRLGECKLSAAEKQAIALRVAQMIQEMDLQKTGEVRMAEWVHYMLMAHSGRFAGKQINSLLSSALAKHKTLLHDLQDMFERADSTKSGYLSLREVVDVYARKLWRLRPGSNARPLTDAELRSGNPEAFAREIMQMMDLNGDEQITYPEFMAYCLGRRKQEVTLNLYDLSKGAAEAMAPYLVGKELQGIWHTGIVVFGKEYYYAKDTVFDEPGATSFGEPTRKIHLGYTLWRQEELHEFVVNELKPVFHRDTYDVVTNNCNHFTDRVCMYLLGRHVPKEVLQQPDLLLQSKFVRVLRPVLNWWLRDRVAAREQGKDLPQGRPRLKPGDKPLPGTVVTVHPEEDTPGPPILARIMERTDANASGTRGWMQIWDSCAVHTSRCSGEVKSGLEPDVGDALWVQYFDIRSGSQKDARFRPQIRTELVPCVRLSLVNDTAMEAVYLSAIRAMGVSTLPTAAIGSGLGVTKTMPGRVPTPLSVGGKDELLDAPHPPAHRLVPQPPHDLTPPPPLPRACGARPSEDVTGAFGSFMPSGAKESRAEKESIEALVQRGFDRQAAEAAMLSANGCFDKALRLLLLGPGRDGDGRVSQL